MTPAEIVRRIIECDNGRDKAGYRALLHDDYLSMVHGEVQNTTGDAEADALEDWWTATPDSHLEEVALHVAGDIATLRYTLAGTNTKPLGALPATGKRFETEGCTIFEMRDGRVKNTWRFADTLGMLRQLGVIPG